MNGVKTLKIEQKDELTPETLELLSGIGTKPLKIIAATVYEWEIDGLETRQKMKRVKEGKKRERKRNAKHNENPAAGHCKDQPAAQADKQRSTHLQEMAAKLFVHGKNKQEANQLQKSMSFTANYSHFQKQQTD